MTVELIELIAAQGVFRPRGHFTQLAADHVPFDQLLARSSFEAAALLAVTGDDTAVGVLGPRGAGKSSLIAHVCAHLPGTHLALRVPVTGADDPTSVSILAAVALSQALDDIDLERYQREALERARADTSTQARTPGGLRSGTLGGGAIPAQVHAELTTLREELTANRLAASNTPPTCAPNASPTATFAAPSPTGANESRLDRQRGGGPGACRYCFVSSRSENSAGSGSLFTRGPPFSTRPLYCARHGSQARIDPDAARIERRHVARCAG